MTQALVLTASETEALCLKAARGAGLSWGLAEEAGAAARWLRAQGVDGAGAILAALRHAPFAALVRDDHHWHPADTGVLCPLATGAALSDFASLPNSPLRQDITLGPVAIPLILVPFVARVAKRLGGTITMTWDTGFVVIGQQIPALDALLGVPVATLRVSSAPNADQQAPMPHRPIVDVAVPATVIAALEALAMATTVPASEASRTSGAGAGLDDNT